MRICRNKYPIDVPLCLHVQAPHSTAHAWSGKYVIFLRRVEPFRRLITRTCAVCDWRREAVEPRSATVTCPQCYAPTNVLKEELLVPLQPGKNAIAVALSRLGAAKGGAMRAQRLSAARRREIARAAAVARWRRR